MLLTDADNTQYREFFDQAIVPEVDMDYYSKLEESNITTLGISLDLNRVAFTKVLCYIYPNAPDSNAPVTWIFFAWFWM